MALSSSFNGNLQLDYAARDKDASRVLQCYDNIVVALNDILSRIWLVPSSTRYSFASYV